MLILETETEIPPVEVVERAKEFFTGRLSPYTGFVLDSSESHVRFHTEAGTLTIGMGRRGDRNVVRGSTSRLHHGLSQFLTTLARPEDVRRSLVGSQATRPALPAGG
jgi:hypothetical protein